MPAFRLVTARIQAFHLLVRPLGTGRAIAQCPAHNDKAPSLSITAVEDRVLIHCHAGCSPRAIVEALGLTMADLFDRRWR